ncbi:PREDICTED: uncharacterized protein LOC105144338 [Acromyrmex echinatior]|uniref:uncharacterized protein LOC105144338 n=1 Tax=Acromyrmex echinatior TaxID=103372 RepID=UPI000580BD65|nr:PREDICTED: uncharacterized protein LOC105144338 [Acromyrmex echinatior]
MYVEYTVSNRLKLWRHRREQNASLVWRHSDYRLPTTNYPLYYITGHRRACSSISSSVLYLYSRVSFVDINEKSDSIGRNKYQKVQTKLIIDSKLIMPGTRSKYTILYRMQYR